MDLKQALPMLLPGAIAWAEQRSKMTARIGYPLTTAEHLVAQQVGVQHPELVRVEMVSSLPLPDDSQLRSAALSAGLLGPGMVGLTLGHSIFICHGHKTVRLLSHELRHVHQYEVYGSIGAFLQIYLRKWPKSVMQRRR